MLAGGDANTAILGSLRGFACSADVGTRVAGAGPFPYITSDIIEAPAVGTKVALCFRYRIACPTRIALLVSGEPACGGIVAVIFYGAECIVAKPLGSRKSPFFVAWQTPAFTGLRGKPSGIVHRIHIADAGYGRFFAVPELSAGWHAPSATQTPYSAALT